MATERTRRGSGGTRKIGRGKKQCERYRQEHRREKNKVKRLTAMIKNLKTDNNMRITTEARIEELQKWKK